MVKSKRCKCQLSTRQGYKFQSCQLTLILQERRLPENEPIWAHKLGNLPDWGNFWFNKRHVILQISLIGEENLPISLISGNFEDANVCRLVKLEQKYNKHEKMTEIVLIAGKITFLVVNNRKHLRLKKRNENKLMLLIYRELHHGISTPQQLFPCQGYIRIISASSSPQLMHRYS